MLIFFGIYVFSRGVLRNLFTKLHVDVTWNCNYLILCSILYVLVFYIYAKGQFVGISYNSEALKGLKNYRRLEFQPTQWVS